jgi:hypothetical protein
MPIGDGLFGSPKGTYGKYLTGPTTSPLSAQFSTRTNLEDQQRRRFKRKRESGFVGNGYTAGYPSAVGTMSANPLNTNPYAVDPKTKKKGTKPASSKSGSGNGGTAAGYIGGLGS